jgi:antitoxin (DNA-binding transcriptional repressor) of toxin-antitoxin stability system
MQRAAQGKTVTLTRRARAVAEICALRASFDAAAASQAVDALRRWRQGLNPVADERQDGAGP